MKEPRNEIETIRSMTPSASRVAALTGQCQSGCAQIKWRGAKAWVNARFLSDNNCQTKEEQ